MTEPNLHDTTDASVWAAEFCKRWPSALCQIPGEEGVSDGDDFDATMTGWFANAIMAGVDSATRSERDGRERIMEAQYLVWSHEHGAWWGPNSRGYFVRLEHAGRYSREEALGICALARDGWDGEGRPSEVPVRENDMLECLELFEAKFPERQPQ